jgi:hypothetical protein
MSGMNGDQGVTWLGRGENKGSSISRTQACEAPQALQPSA